MQRLDVIQDILDLFDALGRPDPEFALGTLQAFRLDVLDLHDGVVSLLSPLKLLVQEVEHGEVQAPHVVPASQVNVVVRVQAGERDGAPEVSIFALGHRLAVCVQMLLGQAEVHDKDATILAVKHEVRGFDITVDEATFVDFFNRDDHFNEDLDGYLEVVSLFEAATRLGQIDAEQVHHDEVLLHVHDVVVRVGHVLQS